MKTLIRDPIGKFILILSIITIFSAIMYRTSNWVEIKKVYIARSCDRNGCIVLSRFTDILECRDFNKSIVKLHQLKKDKPGKVLGCQEEI
jgi:hypothetical protein